MEKQQAGKRNGCGGCAWAKNHHGGACYCVKYGYVVGYPKIDCKGYESNEQVRQPESEP